MMMTMSQFSEDILVACLAAAALTAITAILEPAHAGPRGAFEGRAGGGPDAGGNSGDPARGWRGGDPAEGWHGGGIAAGVAGGVAGAIAGSALSGALPPGYYNPSSPPPCRNVPVMQRGPEGGYHFGQMPICE